MKKLFYLLIPVMMVIMSHPIKADNLLYADFELIDTVVVKSNSGDSVFSLDEVEIKPAFEGGFKVWAKFLSSSLKYPPLARQKNITGQVIVDLIVEKDGSLSNFAVAKTAGYLLDSEAIRVLTNSPKWIPGKKAGEPVRVKMQFPIWFQLSSQPFD